MRLAFLTAAALMSTMVTTEAREGGLTDTATLGVICRQNEETAVAYVMGVVEQAYLTKTAKFCIKKGYTMVQARDIMCRYIATEAPPEVMPLSAAAVTNEVLGLEWPCL